MRYLKKYKLKPSKIKLVCLRRDTITKYVVSLVDLANIYHALKPEALNEIRTVEEEKGLPEKTPTFEELQEIICMKLTSHNSKKINNIRNANACRLIWKRTKLQILLYL